MSAEVILLPLRPSAYSDPAPNAVGAGTKPNRKNNKKKVEDEWAHYMGDETLEENWTRFLHDLGLGIFKSKTQCKKALAHIWVNIHDFLAAVNTRNAAARAINDEAARGAVLEVPVNVRFFPSRKALASYTLQTHKVYPRRRIDKESPLKLLLTHM